MSIEFATIEEAPTPSVYRPDVRPRWAKPSTGTRKRRSNFVWLGFGLGLGLVAPAVPAAAVCVCLLMLAAAIRLDRSL
jgi:hypothetical protein